MANLSKTALVKRLGLFKRALNLIWEATGIWTVGWGLLLVIQGALPALTVYLSKVLVDEIAGIIGAGTSLEVVEPLIGPLVLLGGTILLMQLLQGGIGWVRTAQAEILQDHIKARVHDQAARVDLEFYESPAYYDEMERANSQADKDSLVLLEGLGQIIQHGVTLCAIAALIIPYGIWLPIVLLVSTLPALWVVVRHNVLHHTWWTSTTEKRRRTQYYDWILTSRYYASEVRVFKLSKHFRSRFNQLRSTLRKAQLALMRKQSVSQAGAGIVAFLVTGAVMGWMVMRAMRGLATLGDLALFYQAFQKGQSLTRMLLGNIGQVYTNMLFLEHLFNFLDIEPKMKAPAIRAELPASPYAIKIENVDFRYPGSEQLALKGFSLDIPAKSTVAILGPNGAGKSTLIKMLCRFYDPEQGSIKINGVDVKDVPHDALLREVTVLFQYWVNYAGTLAETIAMGDIQEPVDMARVKAAGKASGVISMLDQLPAGYDTLLDKRFSGGVDLSGGQWQRVALARAFYRKASILLLDEPTSYMDPWAEARWLDRFFELAKEQTTVIVTHRLSTAMRADKIYVMDAGKVIESGTHDELLIMEGLYAQSWNERRASNAELRVTNAELRVSNVEETV
ncbi:MAG: ABC transporter ATP-binding protein [Rhodothermales bacterium]